MKSIRYMRYKRQSRKATDIPYDVKVTVAIRDNGICINCHNKKGIGKPNAHFIARQFGGLGIEENILDLCDTCHKEFDNSSGDKKIYLEHKYEEYLRSKYTYWNREMLVLKNYNIKICKLCHKKFGTKSKTKEICKVCENNQKHKKFACTTKISPEI
ncbi:hypothetical protein [uncultured Clostridium sp.]|uniref:hypothetical protein n=1 Tax=uncultured Clostridium sp. TaxID=59620 RepID=UPI00272C4BAD|nr:hypothetical protein [uncultured Clostridium sp.]